MVTVLKYEFVQWTLHHFQGAVRHVGVDFSGLGAVMAQEDLAQVGSLLKQVGRKAVSQRMWCHRLWDSSFLRDPFYHFEHTFS